MNRFLPLSFALALSLGCNAHRPDGTVECRPDAVITVACDNSVIGTCSGDPVIRVCNGNLGVEECRDADPSIVVEDDDSGSGLCPHAAGIVCPASGLITIVTRPVVRDSAYTCDWRIAEPIGGVRRDAGGPGLPDAGPPGPGFDAGPGTPGGPDAGPGGPPMPDAGGGMTGNPDAGGPTLPDAGGGPGPAPDAGPMIPPPPA
ncbi:MAG: hypothetical protein AB7S26_10370 [Sandaracinaceae bacterium]